MPRVAICMFTAGLMVATASGQDYPNKPIRIFTGNIGGGSDFTTRIIAPGVSERLGQQVIVDNRVAQIAIESVAKAPPDGYTLLLIGSPLWVLPFLQSNLAYDPVRDFLPISLADSAPSVVVIHPSLPVKSIKELIALAKVRPGELNFASGSAGSSSFLAGELFKSMAGVNIQGIAYKSTGPALIDLLGGHVQLAFSSAGPVAPHAKAGRLRALAVTSLAPSPLAPGLPTVSATVPGYEAVGVAGVFAPVKTPAAIIGRLNRELVQVLSQPDVKEKLFNSGVEAVSSSPDQLAAIVKSDSSKLGKMVKDLGIRRD